MLHDRLIHRADAEIAVFPGACVTSLVAAIDAACEGPAELKGRRIIAALRQAAANPDILTPERRTSCSERYARHPIWADPAGRFTVLSLVWGPGQFSVPHAHATWCAYAVAENVLTETLYDFDVRRQQARQSAVAERRPGYACFAQAGLDQIHRLGNAGSGVAISLHVYGVEGARVGTHVNRPVDVAAPEG